VYQNGGLETGAAQGAVKITDFTIDTFGADTAVRLAGVRIKSMRRGSDGNGTNDYKQLRTATALNYTGTLTTVWTANFLTCNTNDCSNSTQAFTDGTPNVKSVRFLESVNGNTANEQVRVTEVTLWGWNHDDYKPQGAIWIAALP
jgi:hypothetical protein